MGKPVSVVRNSKFCVDLLIGFSNRARSLFTIPTEDSIKRRELVFICYWRRIVLCFKVNFFYYSYFWLQIPRQTVNGQLIVCDLTSINISDCINNNRKQLDSLTAILESIDKLENVDSLLLIGYPLLTQVNVGIFFILINMFLKVFIICLIIFLLH